MKLSGPFKILPLNEYTSNPVYVKQEQLDGMKGNLKSFEDLYQIFALK